MGSRGAARAREAAASLRSPSCIARIIVCDCCTQPGPRMCESATQSFQVGGCTPWASFPRALAMGLAPAFVIGGWGGARGRRDAWRQIRGCPDVVTQGAPSLAIRAPYLVAANRYAANWALAHAPRD